MFPRTVSRFFLTKPVHIGCFSFILRKTSSHNINFILLGLDKDIKNKTKVNVSLILQDLQSIDPNWPHMLNGQKLLASVIHNLYQNDHHCDLNVLIDFLHAKNFDIWGGLSTTILKSYLKQKSWGKAVSYFENAKHLGIVKHLRIYNDVIVSLADNDLLKLSYHYFLEVQQQELCMTTKLIKSINHNTLLQLLQCVMRKETNYEFHDDSDTFMRTPNVNTMDIVHSVIAHIQNRAKPVPNHLVSMLGSILKSVGNYAICFTSERNMSCMHCNSLLIPNINFSDVCDDIALNIKNHILKHGWYKDFKYINDLLEDHKYFDIVIDAGNVLYKGKKVFSPERLKDLLSVLEHSSTTTKRIALVFSYKSRKFENLKFIEEFKKRNICNLELESITAHKTHDDLVLCYLAARSDIFLQPKGGSVTIISNDKFIDHRFIAAENQNKFFNWIRHRQRNIDGKGNLMANNILPVIKSDNGDLHLISNDRNVCCVKDT